MKRYLLSFIKKDLKKKIVLVSGPRQSGKTTVSKMIENNFDYLNYDYDDDRSRLSKKEWDRKNDLIIFDEIHKMPKWKSWLKGVYDVEGNKPSILVTGSAQLDTFRKVGDSLAGRYFSYRLHPFDLKEIKLFSGEKNLEDAFFKLLNIGGFPEPFLEGNIEYYKRWRKTHLDIILRQDMLDLENVTNITGVENLVRLLRSRIGSTVSYDNLARDLGVDPKTVKSWIQILERLYVIFKVTPYSKKIKNSLLKAPKYYFFDNGQVDGDEGAKLENLVACALLKEAHFLEDTLGHEVGLHFLRTKNGIEIDFLITVDHKPTIMIEVKWADDQLSKNFFYFENYLKGVKKMQVVGVIRKEKTKDSVTEIRSAVNWLSDLKINE